MRKESHEQGRWKERLGKPGGRQMANHSCYVCGDPGGVTRSPRALICLHSFGYPIYCFQVLVDGGRKDTGRVGG